MMISAAHAATRENLVSNMSQPYPILIEALTQIAASNDRDQISEIARNAAQRILSPEAVGLIQSKAGMFGDVQAPLPITTLALPFPADSATTLIVASAIGDEIRSTDCALSKSNVADRNPLILRRLPIEEVSEYTTGQAMSDPRGEIVAVQTLARAASAAISRCIDLGKQVETNTHLRLERDEVRHRLKNVYASSIGLANLSLPREHSEGFAQRLRTLAGVHDFLDREGRDNLSIPLKELLVKVLSPYRDPNMRRILAEGPDMEVSSTIAVALGLLVNELATNALKHGALSTGSGQILIQWTCCDGEIGLWWREIGGPQAECTASPSQGSKLMRMIVESQLRGKMEHSVTKLGLRFSALFPMG